MIWNWYCCYCYCCCFDNKRLYEISVCTVDRVLTMMRLNGPLIVPALTMSNSAPNAAQTNHSGFLPAVLSIDLSVDDNNEGI